MFATTGEADTKLIAVAVAETGGSKEFDYVVIEEDDLCAIQATYGSTPRNGHTKCASVNGWHYDLALNDHQRKSLAVRIAARLRQDGQMHVPRIRKNDLKADAKNLTWVPSTSWLLQ